MMARTKIDDIERELSPEELRQIFGGRSLTHRGHICDEFCKAKGHKPAEGTDPLIDTLGGGNEEGGGTSGEYGGPSGGFY